MRFRSFFLSLTGLILAAAAADAGCYADYKAQQGDPVQLAYGVAQINGACSIADARNELAARLEAGGWVLLTIIGTFDESGLDERKASAGDHFLRF